MVKVSSLALAGLAQGSYPSAAPYLLEQDAQAVLDASPPDARLDKVDPLRRESLFLSPTPHLSRYLSRPELSTVSPFFIPTEESTALPNESCNITSASLEADLHTIVDYPLPTPAEFRDSHQSTTRHPTTRHP